MAKQASLAQRIALPSDDDQLTLEDILDVIGAAIEDRKGERPVAIDLSGQLDYLDYIVICTGSTELHTKAIADSIQQALSHYDIMPDGLAGYQHGNWILLDYGILIVHVFMPALRDFYRLEELWGAGDVVELK
jgi:ribosome-associated protein